MGGDRRLEPVQHLALDRKRQARHQRGDPGPGGDQQPGRGPATAGGLDFDSSGDRAPALERLVVPQVGASVYRLGKERLDAGFGIEKTAAGLEQSGGGRGWNDSGVAAQQLVVSEHLVGNAVLFRTGGGADHQLAARLADQQHAGLEQEARPRPALSARHRS